jgi:hypothetical protein
MKAESKSQRRRLRHQLPPGSDEALEQGCKCPVLDNNHGRGRGDGNYVMNVECPLHGEGERDDGLH